MEIESFDELQNRLQELYASRDYTAALELAQRATPRFLEQAPLLYYWRIALSARLYEPEKTYRLLDEALRAGVWYGDMLLRKSPSLRALQGQEEFERLVERNHRLRQTDTQRKFPLLVLRSPERCAKGGQPCPFMLALHTNGGTAQDSIEFWQPVASAGWLVGAPQSSQAMWRGAYAWDDLQIASADIQKHYQALVDQYAVDPQRFVLAGHSMGGEVAIWLALSGIVPTSGFIAVGPAGPLMSEVESWGQLLRESPRLEPGGDLSGRLRGYLLAGEEDESVSHENIHILAETLGEYGIPCEVEEVPLAGHDYQPEYEAAMLRALEFVVPS